MDIGASLCVCEILCLLHVLLLLLLLTLLLLVCARVSERIFMQHVQEIRNRSVVWFEDYKYGGIFSKTHSCSNQKFGLEVW